jgi:hypothetical protein
MENTGTQRPTQAGSLDGASDARRPPPCGGTQRDRHRDSERPRPLSLLFVRMTQDCVEDKSVNLCLLGARTRHWRASRGASRPAPPWGPAIGEALALLCNLSTN